MLIHGDCLEKLKELEDNSVDSIVTDPPYGLSFMGKKWDYDVPSKEVWQECLRVLKPGGYLLSFAGTRTQHRMAVNIEDAGFEIRDMIAWVYGSGFPKSLNIGKAIDKLQGNERVSIGEKIAPDGVPYSKRMKEGHGPAYGDSTYGNYDNNPMDTKGNSEWEGWGTALKPALEPITVARKPLSEKTVAENVLKWGTGGINIDGSRVGMEERTFESKGIRPGANNIVGDNWGGGQGIKEVQGRFPANLIHDGSEEVTDLLNDSARFFYCAKASKADRDEGLEGFENEKYTAGNYSQSPVCKTCDKTLNGTNNHTQCSGGVYYREMASKITKNNHPTVKPTKLMQYLVKLVTPKGGVVLDPFMGSGSTGKACKLEGFDFIGIEREEEYIEIAKARIGAVEKPLL